MSELASESIDTGRPRAASPSPREDAGRDITGSAGSGGLRVEVYPGGALSSLALDRRAMAQGSRALAAGILAAVAEATAVANQRTKAALHEALDGLGEDELTLLGLNQEATLTERAEATTPDSWRA
ncbi:YbaB/EbfC family nucleoid-associated protein [Actinophytocola sp.]|uniref:YbaB/EbfC family nucleoid-associated protein n=1 Tax=Actinophytocola sp. TaxID=1872138 RepID=UPI002EDB726E